MLTALVTGPKNLFSKSLLDECSVLKMRDWLVWGGNTVVHSDGKYYMLFSRWPRETGHDGWVTHSEIACAVADCATGPFHFIDTVITRRSGKWDADVSHNPTLIQHNAKYYLYYTGNYGDGTYWDNRNHQRVGVAVADHPAGPWQRFDEPLLDVTPDSWDSMVTTNPSCTQIPDGRFLLIYKAVGSEHEAPFYGPVVHGAAFADNPLGPFIKHHKPIFEVKGAKFPGEDPFIWTQDGKIYAFIKDNNCYYSPYPKSIILFESQNGINWTQCENAFITRKFNYSNGKSVEFDRVERPQLLLENGIPSVLYCGVKPQAEKSDSFNIHFKIKFQTN
ncbi:MAG: glycoside hydrolase family protein [Victivallaceae bacterium]|nr:glycoside hydrolase family protein [Victivallaceae bacterium]